MRSGKTGQTGFATSKTQVTYQRVSENGVFARRRQPLTPLQPTCKPPLDGDPTSLSNGDAALHPMETRPSILWTRHGCHSPLRLGEDASPHLLSYTRQLNVSRRETESAEKSQKSERKERYDKKRPENFFHPIGENNYDAN